MNSTVSNVQVVSNIYPVTTISTIQLPGCPERTVGVQDDPLFRRQIRCRKALKQLAQWKAGGAIDDRQRIATLLDYDLVDAAQIEAYWDNGRCVDCPPGERPFGIVSDGDGFRVECRCQKPNCPAKNPTSA
jgi:hypothetical protein